MAKIIVTRQYLRPTLTNGDPNPLWDRWLWAAIRGYHFNERTDGKFEMDGLQDLIELNIERVSQIVEQGMQVEDYPAYLKIAEADLGNLVPATLAGAYVLDDNGEPTAQRKTWAQWRPEAPIVAGFAYVALIHQGQHLPGTVIRAFHNAPAYTVLSEVEARDEIAAAE